MSFYFTLIFENVTIKKKVQWRRCVILTKQKPYSWIIKRVCFSLILVMLMLSLTGCSFSLAWFSDKKEDTSGDLPIANIGLEVYAYDTNSSTYQKIEDGAGQTSMAFHHGDQLSTGLVKIKNTSSVSVLLRLASVSIATDSFIVDSQGNPVFYRELGADELSLNMDTLWIFSNLFENEEDPTHYAGDYYYNAVIPANGEVAFITSIDIIDTTKLDLSDPVYVNFEAEAIAYDNNPYKTSSINKPWSPIPDTWKAYL